jgi:iron(III) transport system substrate-binding protein
MNDALLRRTSAPVLAAASAALVGEHAHARQEALRVKAGWASVASSSRGRARWLLAICLAAWGSAACKARPREVVIYTSVDQVFSEPIFEAFEAATGTKVRAVFDTEETKSTGVLNRLVAESQSPQADVFWSNDPVRPFLLIKRGLVAPYLSPAARGIPEAFRAADGAWTAFAARARVLLVNKNRVLAGAMPRSVRDLADPRWKGQTAIANPLFGTTTMHVAALFVAWGDDQTRAYLRSLKENGVRIASSNGEVKRLVSGGEVAFGLSDTDDADEAIKEGAPVEVILPDQEGMGTLVMPTSVALVQRSPHPEQGKQMIDYLLSPDVERRMAEAAAHMPLRSGIATPPSVKRVSDIRAMQIDYAKVGAEMERIQPWLRHWVGL